MIIRQHARGWISLAAASVLAVTLAGAALGQQPAARARPPAPAASRTGAPAHQHFDGRYSNNRYYYDRGYTIRRPPPGSIGGLRGPRGGRYWYHRGDWYRGHDGAWVVWQAPVGVFVPWLPPYFSTIWWYGVPYYYANDTYYIWDSDRREYQVVAPPAGIEETATTQAPASDRLFIYPKNGQSAARQSQDEYECHRWAMTQTGFNPTQPGGGVPAEQVAQKRSDYLRADASCLEGRGYTVR
ncbi:MAG TPA: DUF6515 family protein [Steroidobacteraceae bacterium]|nr:DUF6515 family protein [Steroidobacteraceae bacterium]